jgi:activator of HSP90 ATPase
MTGVVESGVAKIYFAPAMVNNFVPKIGGVSLVAVTPPGLVVTGTTGVTYAKATVDAAGHFTDLVIEGAATLPADTTYGTLYKHRLIGTWTSADGAFTSVNTLLKTNQLFRMCAGEPEWL